MATFWTAYVMTRPFGASVADWVGVRRPAGASGSGPVLVSLVALLAIVAVVARLEVTSRRPDNSPTVVMRRGDIAEAPGPGVGQIDRMPPAGSGGTRTW